MAFGTSSGFCVCFAFCGGFAFAFGEGVSFGAGGAMILGCSPVSMVGVSGGMIPVSTMRLATVSITLGFSTCAASALRSASGMKRAISVHRKHRMLVAALRRMKGLRSAGGDMAIPGIVHSGARQASPGCGRNGGSGFGGGRGFEVGSWRGVVIVVEVGASCRMTIGLGSDVWIPVASRIVASISSAVWNLSSGLTRIALRTISRHGGGTESMKFGSCSAILAVPGVAMFPLASSRMVMPSAKMSARGPMLAAALNDSGERYRPDPMVRLMPVSSPKCFGSCATPKSESL